jgi:two-component system NtrC family sensor kinase
VTLAARLTRLADVLVALSGSPIPTHLFQTLADLAPAAVPCDYLAVCLPSPDGPGYLVHSLAALPSDISARVWPPDEGLPARTMRTGQATVVDDLDGGTGSLDAILAGGGLRGVLTVPVRRGFEIAGALLFASRSAAAYGPEDLQVAAVVAAGLGSALESARAYQALADERSTLAAVLGSTSDAVVMLNDDGIVLLANPAVGPVLGVAPDTMIGRALRDVPGHEPLRRLFEHRAPRTAELALPDGRTAQASVVSVVTPYGEPVGVAAVLRDITLLKHLDKMKSDFVSTVSHDLKNPISVIEGTAELISWNATDPALQRRVQRIRDEARYMAELVSDLLDLGKIEAGLGPPKERIDAAGLVADAVRKIAPSAEAKGVAMEHDLAPGAWVSAAPARLTQVVLNLVGNAVKYTPSGGRVTVSVACRDGAAPAVLIRVADTGIGIPARHLSRVFDKFYRVQDPAAQDVPGTGLGLAIAKSIVDGHDGRILVESAEGAGSVFTVELPGCPPAPSVD